MQVKFDQDSGVNTAKKILDAGPLGALVAVQVLDASTLYLDVQRDILMLAGLGAAPNNVMGFQLKAADRVFQFWFKGELWGRSDTQGAIINAEILFKLKGTSGPGRDDIQPPALTD